MSSILSLILKCVSDLLSVPIFDAGFLNNGVPQIITFGDLAFTLIAFSIVVNFILKND